MSNILDAVRSVFGSVPCSCFMSFILKFGYGSVCVMLPLSSYLLAIGSSVLCVMFQLVVMFIVSCPHWFVLVKRLLSICYK